MIVIRSFIHTYLQTDRQTDRQTYLQVLANTYITIIKKTIANFCKRKKGKKIHMHCSKIFQKLFYITPMRLFLQRDTCSNAITKAFHQDAECSQRG